MAFSTVQLIALMSAVVFCSANPTGSGQDATQTSTANHNPVSVASPETAVTGVNPSPAQINMGGINEIVSEALRNSMANNMAQGSSSFNTMGGMPSSNMMNFANIQSRPAALPRTMASLPMNILSMMNPLSMLTGGGGGSPFGMMRPMMMMNVMDNMFEMFGF